MIPKIIHYAWLGHNRMPHVVKRCVKSFSSVHPDFVIKRWELSDLKGMSCPYFEEAVRRERWALASDYLRLRVLYETGGVWLDTDMKLLRRLDDLLYYRGFIATEQNRFISAGIIGAEKEHPLIKTLLSGYETKSFSDSRRMEDETIVKYITDTFVKYGWFDPSSGKAFLPDGFRLLDGSRFYPQRTRGGFAVTEDCYTIHYGLGSWLASSERFKQRFINGCLVTLGPAWVERLVHIKNGGGMEIER